MINEQTKLTPGPYHAGKEHLYGKENRYIAKFNGTFAETKTGLQEEAAATAAYFTCAANCHEELLEIARLLVLDYERAPNMTGMYKHILDLAHAAIKKAETL